MIYRDLKVFRMTGGEPLMDSNTFKVFDYVNENPPLFRFEYYIKHVSQDKLFDKFIDKIKACEEIRVWEDPKDLIPIVEITGMLLPYKHFSLYVSVDGVGKQAEYMRDGLDFDKMYDNCRRVLRETDGTEISFINTFQLLSIPPTWVLTNDIRLT